MLASLREHFQDLSALATKYDFPHERANSYFFQGWLLAHRGQVTQGWNAFHNANQMRADIKQRLFQPLWDCMLVDALYGAGELTNAIAHVEHTGEVFLNAELFRLNGALLLQQYGVEEDAEVEYQRAIDIAQQQGAKSLELRTSVSLCRLWQKQCRSPRPGER